jgi:hypothetical protein
MSTIADWPDDADGDVFRRLHTAGFDFSQSRSIDYNVDFKTWPPSEAALDLLVRHTATSAFSARRIR